MNHYHFNKAFLSDENSQHIMGKVLVVTKPNKAKFYQNMSKFRLNLYQLQKYVLDNCFNEIYSKVGSLEKTLIVLNNMCVNELETIVRHTLGPEAPPCTDPCAEMSVDKHEENLSQYHEEHNAHQHIEQRVLHESHTEARVEPRTKARVEPLKEARVEPLKEARVESRTEATVEPLKEATVEPLKEPTVEPLKEARDFVPHRQRHRKEDNQELEQRSLCTFYTFSSNKAVVTDTSTYSFKVDLHNVKSIWIESFEMQCTFYNVTETNNQFIINEDTHQTTIIIPVGYYNLQDLLETIKGCLNSELTNEYIVAYHKNKHLVSIECKKLDYFHMKSDLLPLLGFKHNSYSYNNMYMSEQCPHELKFVDQYIKLYLNGNEVFKCTGDKQYFEKFKIDMETSFGKTYTQSAFTSFELFEPIKSLTSVIFQLEIPCAFNIVFGYEYNIS